MKLNLHIQLPRSCRRSRLVPPPGTYPQNMVSELSMMRAVSLLAFTFIEMLQYVRGFADPSRVPPRQDFPHLQASKRELPLSRARLLQLVPPGIFGAMVWGATATKPSSASIPTTDDYAFGSGSKVKRTRIEDDLSALLPKSSVNPKNPAEIVGAISGELDRMQALVRKERWGDALTRLRSFPLTTLKSPTLGLGSVGDVARSLGVSNSKASEILEASMEAGFTLRQVEDVVFSNTRMLEFFNSADLKQVEDLAKNSGPTDLTEPLELLSDTKQLVVGVKNMMDSM